MAKAVNSPADASNEALRAGLCTGARDYLPRCFCADPHPTMKSIDGHIAAVDHKGKCGLE
jgi:hypothetical protein